MGLKQKLEEVESSPKFINNEELYLVCISCSEAFGDLKVAMAHQVGDEHDPERDELDIVLFDGFEIKPESEAF